MKERAIRYLAGFLIFMLICTFVSRGIYVHQMPQVTAARAEERNMTHQIEASGHVAAVDQRAVTVLSGIRVRQVCVSEGEHVKKGKVLFRLERKGLEKKVERLTEKIAEQQRKKREILQEQKEQDKTQKKAVKQLSKRGQEDMENVICQQKELVEKAKREYEKAKKKLSSYPEWEQYLAAEQEKSTEYQEQKVAAEKKDATKEEKEAFSIFSVTFAKTLQEEWQIGKEERAEAVTSTKETWEDAKKEMQLALDRKKQETERAVEDLKGEEEKEADGKEEIQKEMQRLEAKRETYQTLLKRDGEVKSKWNATIVAIHVSVGEKTTDGAACILSDDRKGKRFLATLAEKKKGRIRVGDTVELVFRSGAVKLTDAVIEHIKYEESGSYQVSVGISDDRIDVGEDGELQFTAETGRQPCCIPISGLHAGSGEQYVLVLKETETFLGTEYHVEKRRVAVVDKNEEYAALKNSPIEPEEKIVVSSDKDIAPEDVVRMKEPD